MEGFTEEVTLNCTEFQRKNGIVRVDQRKDYFRRKIKRVKWTWKNGCTSHFQLPVTEMQLE